MSLIRNVTTGATVVARTAGKGGATLVRAVSPVAGGLLAPLLPWVVLIGAISVLF